MNYLFPNFLQDINELKKSKEYWKSLSRDILAKEGLLEYWRIERESEEKDFEQYNNFPIISLINNEKTKGLTVNQQDPKIHTKWEMVAYTKESNQYSDLIPLYYLVFNCNLSKKSESVFKKLFKRWIQPDCEKESMEKFIKSLNL